MMSSSIPEASGQRIFLAGKGGVGKTTLATAVAVQHALSGRKTLLLTTDPAAHIGLVLGMAVGEDPSPVPDVPGLAVARIDPVATTQRYQATVLAEAAEQYTANTVERLREELNSPCTEEVAVFRRFLWALMTTDYASVVFDTAPTGHTLRLLSMPLSYQKQLTVKAAGNPESQAVDDEESRTMARALARLRDPKSTIWSWVVYPESTPIQEARRGADELSTIGIHTGQVFVNQLLPESVCVHPLFRKRYAMQQRYLQEVYEKFVGVAIVPVELQSQDVVGLAAVKALLHSMPRSVNDLTPLGQG